MATPVTEHGLEKYDHLSAVDAVVASVIYPGRHPGVHKARLANLARDMPVLYRALARLVEENRK